VINSPEINARKISKMKRAGLLTVASSLMLGVVTLTSIPAAFAAEAPIGLGTAGGYTVLGGSTVVNTGPSVLGNDLGVSPGSAITGFPPGLALGATHVADAAAGQAQSDLTIAYNDAAGRASTGTISADLAGQTLVSGVYTAATSMGLSGALTLDGQGDPDSVFIFQAGSTLNTAAGSNILLTNGAQACNVYWQVGSSATLGVGSDFVGNIMALTSITATTNATVQGRLLARNGAVTLDSNVINAPTCAAPVVPPVVTPAPTVSATTPPATTPPATTSPIVVPSATTPSTATDIYATCAEAEAAGVTNIPSTDTAYTTGLDRDGDGIACEDNGSDTAVLIEAGFEKTAAAPSTTPVALFAGMGLLLITGLTLMFASAKSSRKH
jgi:hypothetical protein